jgi:Fur family ferric uptake transcriptional regulator
MLEEPKMEERSTKDTKFAGRTTQQRQSILEVIKQADRHLDADEIYEQSRKRSPNISLSTVYRNLQLFKEQGLVEERQFGGVRRSYEMVPHSRHHHIVCLGCGKVFEFICPSTEKIKSRLTREKGFQVTDVDVRFSGYCPACQRRLQQSANNKETVQTERR